MAIDKNYRESALSQAKKIAFRYINNPVVNGTKVTDILVILKDHSVYLNTPIESLQEYAERIKTEIVVVMKNGKVLEENEKVSEEKTEVSEESNEDKPKKNKTKK